jgi:uncharacterized membrane protein YgdD (TMEM256/DUF423 family)
MQKKWLLYGVLFMFTGILLGAFGAHGLKTILHDATKIQSFETGVRYQLIHGVAFLAMIRIIDFLKDELRAVFRLLTIGVILFSGSIYLLTWCEVMKLVGWSKVLGPITPIGGVLLLTGWCMLLVKLIRTKSI